MSNSPEMVLVVIRQIQDVDAAQALALCLSDELSLYLLFAHEDLHLRFGESNIPCGVDTFACMLNPEAFGLVVCFSGARDASVSSNLLLLSFFDELGIPTVEIQKELFQTSVAQAASPSKSLALGRFERKSVARDFLAWTGVDGIGYLQSVLVNPVSNSAARTDFVLITSHSDAPFYGDQARHQFAIAVMRLARDHPQLQFLWKPRASEMQQPECRAILSMVEESHFSNLSVEYHDTFDDLLTRCHVGISMVSTALLDYELHGRPVLVFACGETDALLPDLAVQTFRDHAELHSRFQELLVSPDAFQVRSRVPSLNGDRLRTTLRARMATVDLPRHWLLIANRYIAVMREGRTARIEVGKLSPVVSNIDRRIGGLEGQVHDLGQQLRKLDKSVGRVTTQIELVRGRVSKIGERISVLHRSTMAYKAVKLIARLRAKEKQRQLQE